MKSLVRRLTLAAMRLVLRVFFRRVEIAGAGKVPASRPVIFVLNHPNGLVDPLFLLCFSPRPVSFLAKAPLFRMPVIGYFTRALDSIPVYRRQDPGTDVTRNRETFARARELLSRGGVIALFPEGGSHDQPKLLELKTGAARIALGAALEEGLQIVPAGLYYTWKTRFRSSALLTFGEPIAVDPVPLDERGEPPPQATKDLTHRIEAALLRLTVGAESHEALELVRRAERIFSIETEKAPESLQEQLDLRRRLVAGSVRLQERDPARLAAIQARIRRFEAERREAGLPLEQLTPDALTARGLLRVIAGNLGSLLLLPFAAVGAFLHYPAYRLAGFLARQFARGAEDQLATLKAGASMLLFPATWALCAAAAGLLAGRRAALLAIILVPLSGYAALRARESLDLLIGRARALRYAFSGAYAARRLIAERRAIREEIIGIATDLGISGQS